MRRFNCFNLLVFSTLIAGCSTPEPTKVQSKVTPRPQRTVASQIEQEVLQRKVPVFKKKVKRRLPAKVSEENLYIEVIRYYREQDVEGVLWAKDQFLKFFPKSAFADNAVYMAGRALLEHGAFAEAVREYQYLIENYPLGNKYVSALLGKGIAYRRLNLHGLAEQVLRTVKKEFPGSPEADRVDLELKLLEAQRQG